MRSTLETQYVRVAIRLETEPQEGEHKLFQNFLFLLLDLLAERITHAANIWAAEEHKCFVLSPNAKSGFSEAVLVPPAQRLPAGRSTARSVRPERGQSPLPICSSQFQKIAVCRRGRVIRLE